MKVNMNGLRRNLTREFSELTEMIKLMSDDSKKADYFRMDERFDDLVEQHDKVVQYVGILNCVYGEDDDKGFTDQSEILKVRFLNED